ncbi:ferritin-like domain-containing protein [Candidatus Bathyarchaeota archaeon]|nr:ferritin-like domain-containing protein [Candidatus Bathyarchaeota archaeon]
MTSKNDVEAFIRRQIEIEREIVASLNEGLADIDNPAVREVLKGISLDSTKHAGMYSAALDLMTKTPKALTQEQLDRQVALVERHIRMEAELIKRISETLPSIEEEKIRFLLSAILEDEKRHHELLKRVLEIIVKGETIMDKDLWDIIWRNVPMHGSPGG